MPPNTLNNPEKGNLVLIRRASSIARESQTKFLLIWETPNLYHGVRATNGNVRALDVGPIFSHQPTNQFLDTDLGRQILNATTPEHAANAFRVAIDTKVHNLRFSFVYSQAYPIASLLDQNSTFFLRPSAEAIRKVLLGDKCPNEHCQNGLVAAARRAAVYQRYDLPTLTLAGDRRHLPMVCPACIPKNVAIESEKHFLVALRLDTGGRVTNEELDGIRTNQVRLDDARLEAGYQKIKVCPDVVWSVIAHGRSGWIVRHQGRWLQEMQRLSPRSATGTANHQVAMQTPVNDHVQVAVDASLDDEVQAAVDASMNDQVQSAIDASLNDEIPARQMSAEGAIDLPRRTFGQLRDAITQAICSICLADSYKDGDDVVVLPCVHFFHEDCIIAWLRQHPSCPECRQLVSAVQP